MSVKASTIFSRVRSLLDDDNSARYTESADLVPAMNSAIGYITTVFSAAFEQKKLQPFALSELTEPWVFSPTIYGATARINLNESGATGLEHVFAEEAWAIIGVDPNPSTNVWQLTESKERFAHRLTMEEWNYALEDPYTPGYEAVPDQFKRACYTGPNMTVGDGDPYLLLRPGSMFDEATNHVAVWVLLKHAEITAGTSDILFPVTIHPLIEQKMLQYISYQGDDDRLFKITDKEVKELIQLMN